MSSGYISPRMPKPPPTWYAYKLIDDRLRPSMRASNSRFPAELILTNKLKPYRHPFLGILPLRDPSEKAGVVVRVDTVAAVASFSAPMPGRVIPAE